MAFACGTSSDSLSQVCEARRTNERTGSALVQYASSPAAAAAAANV